MFFSILQFLSETLKHLVSVFISGKHFSVLNNFVIPYFRSLRLNLNMNSKQKTGIQYLYCLFIVTPLKGWAYFHEINSLEHLKNLGRLDAVQLDFLDEIRAPER